MTFVFHIKLHTVWVALSFCIFSNCHWWLPYSWESWFSIGWANCDVYVMIVVPTVYQWRQWVLTWNFLQNCIVWSSLCCTNGISRIKRALLWTEKITLSNALFSSIEGLRAMKVTLEHCIVSIQVFIHQQSAHKCASIGQQWTIGPIDGEIVPLYGEMLYPAQNHTYKAEMKRKTIYTHICIICC
jgi:hypothetical protein